jgi:hypothetical protein
MLGKEKADGPWRAPKPESPRWFSALAKAAAMLDAELIIPTERTKIMSRVISFLICFGLATIPCFADTTYSMGRAEADRVGRAAGILNEVIEKERGAIRHRLGSSAFLGAGVDERLVFWGTSGNRHDLADYRLFVLNIGTLEIEPLLNKEMFRDIFKDCSHPSLGEISTSPDGSHIAVGRWLRASPDTAETTVTSQTVQDIILVDVATREAVVLVEDHNFNYGYAFSPDGKHLAYYADAGDNWGGSSMAKYGSGRMVDLKTGTITVISAWFHDVNPSRFSQPVWLNNSRIYYSGLYVPEHRDGETSIVPAIIEVPGGGIRPLRIEANLEIVDHARQRLIFREPRKLVSTDFNGENQETLVEGPTYNLRLQEGILVFEQKRPAPDSNQ